MSAVKLPTVLKSSDDGSAIAMLQRYYGTDGTNTPFGGARFDTWAASSSVGPEANRFTARDLLGLAYLSVDVKWEAVDALLETRAEEFSDLLAAVGPDRDLSDQDAAEMAADDWPGWALQQRLRQLPKVGPTKASKLMAMKRPRLVPVYDNVIVRSLGAQERYWLPLREALTTLVHEASSETLDQKLRRLKRDAALPDAVSPIRVFDVIAWMEATRRSPQMR